MYKRISGVYKITNTINGKFYIGSSNSCNARINDHFYCLRKQTHHNKHLQHSYDKYKEDSFHGEIIAKCSEEYRVKLEQWFLNNTRCYISEIGYNILRRATGGNFEGKRISQYSLEDEFIDEYDSLTEAAMSLGNPQLKSAISRCCKGEGKTLKGYKWRFTDIRDYDIQWKINQAISYLEKRNNTCANSEMWKSKGKKHSEIMKNKHQMGDSKFGYGHLSEEARKEIGNRHSVTMKRKIADNPEILNNARKAISKPVYMIDMKGNIMKRYDSASEAGREINAPCTNIVQACKKDRKVKGYRFQYA